MFTCFAMPSPLLVVVVLLFSSPFGTKASETVSFQQEVMAVLSRGGCNQGACHGNLNGKGGLKLSLRGESAEEDFRTLTREMLGRRINIHKPEESLILQKATGTTPHEGGVRFDPQSLEYQVLKQWIGAGMPADDPKQVTFQKLIVSPTDKILFDPEQKVQLKVQGQYSDGSIRDLSHLVVYETTSLGIVNIGPDGEITRLQNGELVVLVRYLHQMVPVRLAFLPKRQDYAWEQPAATNLIDQHIFARLQALRLTPSPRASDSMFIRRVYLDTIGVLPTIQEAKQFLNDPDPDKRTKLIDALLQRPEFADYWALKWADLLRNEEKTLDRKGVRVFSQWIRNSIDQDKPLNQFAQEIVSGTGSTYQNPAANFYRAIREPYARAEAVAQVFLGIRIACAKCHNHPFDQWTQDQYHAFAGLFDSIDYRVLENNRKDRLDKHEFEGEQVVFDTRRGTLKHPRTREELIPRLLGASIDLGKDVDRLSVLGDWIGDPKNPFFAKAQVNRVWYHLMGRGLVDPIDDFRATNPALDDALLESLTKQWQKQQFRLRPLVRLILNSQTYQFSSVPYKTNRDDETHFARAMIQPLKAEQLFDAICQVLGTDVKFNGNPKEMRAVQIPALSQARRGSRSGQAEQFLKVFGKPERLLTCECERSEDSGVLQAFQLITGEFLQSLLNRSDNHIGKWLEEGRSPSQIIRDFYLAALSREPSREEEAKLIALVEKSEDRRDALEDIVWGLLNSKEFLLRR